MQRDSLLSDLLDYSGSHKALALKVTGGAIYGDSRPDGRSSWRRCWVSVMCC
jgi:hypothetical protein